MKDLHCDLPFVKDIWECLKVVEECSRIFLHLRIVTYRMLSITLSTLCIQDVQNGALFCLKMQTCPVFELKNSAMIVAVIINVITLLVKVDWSILTKPNTLSYLDTGEVW